MFALGHGRHYWDEMKEGSESEENGSNNGYDDQTIDLNDDDASNGADEGYNNDSDDDNDSNVSTEDWNHHDEMLDSKGWSNDKADTDSPLIPNMRHFPRNEFPELYLTTPPVDFTTNIRKFGLLSKLPKCLLLMVINSGIDKPSLLKIRSVCRTWRECADHGVFQHIVLSERTIGPFLAWAKPSPCVKECAHPSSAAASIHHPNTKLGIIRQVTIIPSNSKSFLRRVQKALSKCESLTAMFSKRILPQHEGIWKEVDAILLTRKGALTHLNLFPNMAMSPGRDFVANDDLKRNLEFANAMLTSGPLRNVVNLKLDLRGIDTTVFKFDLLGELINVQSVCLSLTLMPQRRPPSLLGLALRCLPVSVRKLGLVVDAVHFLELHPELIASGSRENQLEKLYFVELTVLNRRRHVNFSTSNAEFQQGVQALFDMFFPNLRELSIRFGPTAAVFCFPHPSTSTRFHFVADAFNWYLRPPCPRNRIQRRQYARSQPPNPLTIQQFYNNLVHLKVQGDSELDSLLCAAKTHPNLLVRLESLVAMPAGRLDKWTSNLLLLLKYCNNITLFGSRPFFSDPPIAIKLMMASLKKFCPKLRVLQILNLKVHKLSGGGLPLFIAGLEAIVAGKPGSLVSLLFEDDIPWDMKQQWTGIASWHGLRILPVRVPFKRIDTMPRFDYKVENRPTSDLNGDGA
ncbi:hypothetical protein HDU76_007015 [Blyttiomyces sp. JEL0837]|nr:hypothetical protein HDU76_007015 [Blyttiomyces sp. JEL0837]